MDIWGILHKCIIYICSSDTYTHTYVHTRTHALNCICLHFAFMLQLVASNTCLLLSWLSNFTICINMRMSGHNWIGVCVCMRIYACVRVCVCVSFAFDIINLSKLMHFLANLKMFTQRLDHQNGAKCTHTHIQHCGCCCYTLHCKLADCNITCMHLDQYCCVCYCNKT